MKIVPSRRILKNPEQLIRKINIKEFYEKRNKILIIRACGGLGDILMHRMIFEDFKLLMPEAEIHFACPLQYHEALVDHPFIDKILDSAKIDKSDYIISYNTTSACGRYECSIAPLSGDHRSDIWANHCGVNLTKHNMHISLTDEEKESGKKIVEKIRNKEGQVVALAPISAMISKNLLPHHIEFIKNYFKDKDYFLFGVHNIPIHDLNKLNIPQVFNLSIREWMGVLNYADYVISVDTSAFHFAGGIAKPVTGIFTFADGLVYSKYYPKKIIVQKHRINGDWDCGPCYNWSLCPKTNSTIKPCLTEITNKMLQDGIDLMLERYGKN